MMMMMMNDDDERYCAVGSVLNAVKAVW